MSYISAAQYAQKWCVHLRTVQRCCHAGWVAGACKVGNTWLIPSDAPAPCRPARNPGSLGRRLSAPTQIVFRSGHADDCLLTIADATSLRALKGLLAYHRCDFQRCIDSFQDSRPVDLFYPPSLLLRMCAAISLGDFSLYHHMQRQLRLMICRPDNATDVQLQLSCLQACMDVSLYVLDDLPEWLRQGDLMTVPTNLRGVAWYSYAKYLHATRAYPAMLIATEARLSLPRDAGCYCLDDIYLCLFAALGHQKLGQAEQARDRMLRVMGLALPDGFIAPFAETLAFMGGLTEQCLQEAFPAHYNAVLKQWQRIFPRWIRAHNERARQAAPATLTRREYEVALYAADGMSNNEIAQALFLSLSTVKRDLSTVYAKAGITRRSELAALLA